MMKDLIGWLLMGAAYGAILAGVLIFMVFPTVFFIGMLVNSTIMALKGVNPPNDQV